MLCLTYRDQPMHDRGRIRSVTDCRRAYGNNHLFATGDGDLYDVEVSGSRWAMCSGGNGFLAHANHFTLPGMNELDKDEDLLNSRLRQIRIETLVERDWGGINAWDCVCSWPITPITHVRSANIIRRRAIWTTARSEVSSSTSPTRTCGPVLATPVAADGARCGSSAARSSTVRMPVR